MSDQSGNIWENKQILFAASLPLSLRLAEPVSSIEDF